MSGLKSITAKHLAISCQCLGVYVALHPCLAAVFTQGVPQPRADLLSSDFARTAQVRNASPRFPLPALLNILLSVRASLALPGEDFWIANMLYCHWHLKYGALGHLGLPHYRSHLRTQPQISAL